MPDMPRTKFNSPWTVENIEAELNGTKNARGNLSMTEKLAQKVETSTYATDKTAIDAEIAALTPAAIKAVDEGAKNVCNWSASTSTISGVTFTMNDDKTVSTSGTATERSQKSLTFTVPSTLKAGRYVLSGCPTGGAQSETILYCLYVWDKTANARISLNDTGNGIEFDWIPDPSHTYTITVDVRSRTNASGLIFKPMICTAEDWAVSKKFAPYCPTLYELYQMLLALQSGTRILSAPAGTLTKVEEPETESREEER